MRYRKFGRTGIDVSELVFGGGFVGGILLHANDGTKRAALDRALDAGINWIDTAQNYGQGKSEEAIGALLADMPEDRRPHISTKFFLDLDRLDDIEGQIESCLKGSLSRLGMSSVTLYQLHNQIGEDALPVEAVLGRGGVCDCLERLGLQGHFAHFGFTALGDPAGCRQIVESGRMASAQVYYNLLNPSAGRAVGPAWSTRNFSGLLEACTAAGTAVMNIRTFAAGVLATQERHGREIQINPGADIGQEERRAQKVFAILGDGYGSTAQAALRFSLAQSGISCVVIGLAELAHLEEALAGAAMGPLPEDAIERLQPLWLSDFAD